MAGPGQGGNRANILEEAAVHALGKDLVSRLAMLLKTVRIHSVQNSALQYSVKIFTEAANQLFAHLGEFTLRGDIDAMFVNDVRIRAEPILWDNIVHLLRELSNRHIGGIQFTGPVNPVVVRSFLGVLLDHEELLAGQGAKVLNEGLGGKGVHQIRFLPRMSLVTDATALLDEEEAHARSAIRLYAELLVTMKAWMSLQEPDVPEVLRGRLLQGVQNLVDLLHESPDWVLSAATYRDPAEYRVVHAVNMCILSIALAHRIDLPRKALMNLGMAALYADSGMRRIGVDLSMAIEPGSVAERHGLHEHPLASAKEVLQTPALTRAQRDRLLVAYEHHTGRDGSGFPPRIKGKPKHLFSTIVSIGDQYDALTSDQFEVSAQSPSQALETMAKAAEFHDPRLLSIFIHMMGPFPVGTVVQLSTGETAVVFRQSIDQRFRHRPMVKIVADPRGRPVEPTLYDLTSCTSSNDFLTHVQRVLPSSALREMTVVQALFAHSDAEEETRPRWGG
jgi:HD-GYP domain-containing protein (c-di-GMP phosphodiesterase class II)